jgi:hypothetical protein
VIHSGVATAVLLGRVGLHPQLYLEATTITDDMIALCELLENGSDATLLVSVSRSADRATRQIHRSSGGNLDHAPAAFKATNTRRSARSVFRCYSLRFPNPRIVAFGDLQRRIATLNRDVVVDDVIRKGAADRVAKAQALVLAARQKAKPHASFCSEKPRRTLQRR